MCGVSGVRTLIYLLEVGFRQDKYENIINGLQEDKIKLPAKNQRERLTGGVGRSPLAAIGHHHSLVHCLVGPDVRWSVPGIGWSVWSGFWALFCMCHARRDCLRLHLRIRRVFFLFRTCPPEILNLRKQLWS